MTTQVLRISRENCQHLMILSQIYGKIKRLTTFWSEIPKKLLTSARSVFLGSAFSLDIATVVEWRVRPV
jgi:hypothetical protein